MEKPNVRILYLYAFALVGLVLVTIGTVRIADIGLKMYIFKKADLPQDYRNRNMPPYPPITIDQKIDDVKCSEKITLEQKTALDNWVSEFKYWNENLKKIDYLASDRQRAASNSFAMILIGLPLYLYHWRIVRKEAKENNKG